MKTWLRRRDLLRLMGLAAGGYAIRNPLHSFIQNAVHGLIRKAIATETAVVPPRNYVFIGLPGAPARWTFDLILNTTANAGFLNNPMVATAIQSSPSQNTYTYKTIPIQNGGNTYMMPPIWGTTVETSAGAFPLSNLMNQMMVIRGCDLEGDGHPTNYMRQLRANSAVSLSGLVADAASTPIPSVEYFIKGNVPSNIFASTIGSPNFLTNFNDPTPLLSVMSPINGFQTFGFRSIADVNSAVDQGLSVLSQYALSNQPGAAALYNTRQSAENLLRQGVANLNSSWTSLLTKYQTTINKNLNDGTGGGLFNSPIYTYKSKTEFNWFNDQAQTPTPSTQTMPTGIDLRSIASTLTIANLAETFALAEFMITQGYSSAVVGGGPSPIGTLPDGSYFISWNDGHPNGVAITTYMTSIQHRAVAAGLMEFIAALKGATGPNGNYFEETVIHFGAEFNRLPRNDMSGADHGIHGSSVSLFSGALPNYFQVVGNTLIDNDPTKASQYTGSFGTGAPMDYLGHRTMTIGNVASTICDLLRVPSPTSNFISLIPQSGSGVAVTEAKNV